MTVDLRLLSKLEGKRTGDQSQVESTKSGPPLAVRGDHHCPHPENGELPFSILQEDWEDWHQGEGMWCMMLV